MPADETTNKTASEIASKTAENSAKNRAKSAKKESPKIDLVLLKSACEQMKETEFLMQYLTGFFFLTNEQAVEMSFNKALEMDTTHKKYFSAYRKRLLEYGNGDYEKILAKAATIIVAVDKICEVRGDTMFQSDLNGIAVSNIFLPSTIYALRDAEDLATLMLPLPIPKY